MRYASFFLLIFLFSAMVPSPACATGSSIIINEVAWMGSLASSADEWIELANTSADPIVLDGWSLLSTTDGKPMLPLSGTLAPGAFYLIERTDDATVPGIPADLIASFGSGTGAGLSNSGETLELRDPHDTVIDSASWTATGPGDASTKQTMERQSDGSWATSADTGGTPKVQNSAGASPPPPPASENPPPQKPSPPPPPASAQNPPQENSPANQHISVGPLTLRLSEILPNPVGPDSEEEFVEIENIGVDLVPLDGWKISDASGAALTLSGAIAPHAFLAFFSKTSNLPSLNNDGDTILLSDPSGSVRDGVSYQKTQEGASLVYSENAWQWTETPTPNKPNTVSFRQLQQPASVKENDATVVAAPLLPAAVEASSPPHTPRTAVDAASASAELLRNPVPAENTALATVGRFAGAQSNLFFVALLAVLVFFSVLGIRIFWRHRSAPLFLVEEDADETQ